MQMLVPSSGPRLPTPFSRNSRDFVSEFAGQNTRDLVPLAVRVIDRIAKDSETQEMMQEGGTKNLQNWQANVSDLHARLVKQWHGSQRVWIGHADLQRQRQSDVRWHLHHGDDAEYRLICGSYHLRSGTGSELASVV
ncbi:hypothetical protein [Bradyrhizobium embrapense]|uniref:hypothetical protein n=1 Tax=Bradyrhizobium embrapense TaxID=630921 RepID=UPI0019D3E736|nr:hypothetical protein [Bradyrhizobium embrapense]